MEFSTVPNPIFIPMEFAKNGIKNVIQKVRQSGQDAQDMTWNDGTPPITLTKLEDGGLPPKGQDYNGVLNAISSHTVFGQNGGRYKWDAQVIAEFDGYPMDAIIQSDDGSCEFKSIVSPNTVNPNNGLSGSWVIYSGQGSIPLATSTTTGIMRVLNVLTSTEVGSALSAAMGKALKDLIDTKLNSSQAFGIGQSRYNLTSSRSIGVTYQNTTNKPIEVSIVVNGGVSSVGNTIMVNGVAAFTFAVHTNMTSPFTFTVPPTHTYRIDVNSSINSWSELR